jgi:TorA maturation chaperone TorD
LAAGTYEGDTAVPYESVYASEKKILMQEPRDQVMDIYAENGYSVNTDLQIPEDHLSFQLEFVALMLDKISEKLELSDSTVKKDIDTTRDFIVLHLFNWLPEFQERVSSFANKAFYPAYVSILIGTLQITLDELNETLEQI